MPLTDLQYRTAKPADKTRRLFDRDGLYLEVTPSGGKYWRYKYRIDGKEKRLSIGSYPETSLDEAREDLLAARKSVKAGEDPSLLKQQGKQARKDKQAQQHENTFSAVAREWHQHSLSGWTERHAHYVLRRLEQDVFPALGQRPINEITTRELIDVLKTIEKRGANELARRMKQTCGQIFRFGNRPIHTKLPHPANLPYPSPLYSCHSGHQEFR